LGETREEAIAELRTQHGREPMKEEIDVALEAVIRRACASMALAV
jgi:hypothetical protein